MTGAVKKARQVHRKAVEQFYEDSCTVYEYRDVKDEATKLTSKKEMLATGETPCKLSFESLGITPIGESAAEKKVSVKLFLPLEVRVRAGSKILVTHEGETTAYKSSGVPGRFATHQEVMLELFRGWA